MDLFLFPQAASLTDGFGIGVNFAYNKLTPKHEDLVVWYTLAERDKILHIKDSDVVIPRKSFFSVAAIKNVLQYKTHAELTIEDLSFLKNYDINNIHCDEIIFYRAIRKLYPNKKITIRFHNCFSRIWVRNLFLKREVGLKYWINLRLIKKLEAEIFSDMNVYKIFISDEDRNFYCSTYGVYNDSTTWHYVPNTCLINKNRSEITLTNKIVWFGGLDSHKVSSVRWFCKSVFPKLLKEFPDMEFHLWGGGTEKLNHPEVHIFGHGFYNGENLPLRNCLYVNPDIIGGGIKLKLMTLLEQGAVIMTSPFGFEGYKKELIDNKYCYVIEESKWIEEIIFLLKKYRAN